MADRRRLSRSLQFERWLQVHEGTSLAVVRAAADPCLVPVRAAKDVLPQPQPRPHPLLCAPVERHARSNTTFQQARRNGGVPRTPETMRPDVLGRPAAALGGLCWGCMREGGCSPRRHGHKIPSQSIITNEDEVRPHGPRQRARASHDRG